MQNWSVRFLRPIYHLPNDAVSRGDNRIRAARAIALHTVDAQIVRSRYGLEHGVIVAFVDDTSVERAMLYAVSAADETYYAVEQWVDAIPDDIQQELRLQGIDEPSP